jgi:class 3 adenylate cyclase/tetratricopeptide (TPR) repeat protein
MRYGQLKEQKTTRATLIFDAARGSIRSEPRYPHAAKAPLTSSTECMRCGAKIREPARFCAGCASSQPGMRGGMSPADRRDVRSNANHVLPLQAERRQITAMFCDLVDSTRLARGLDLEDLAEVMGAYRSAAAETVQRFGGFIARYVGDGVLIYFGWPKTDEFDAERSVRAGLALLDAVRRISAKGQCLRARVGIATGLVVAGETIGPGAQEDATGQALYLAARLEELAEPDTVVIAHATRTQVGEFFDCRDLGTFEVKGFAEPVRAWRVIGEKAVQSRFEALRGSGLTPLVGREEEIELLLRRWNKVKRGEGQVVLLAGDAGIGKSRLIAALEERLRGETYTSLRYFCEPHDQNSALHPIIGHFANIAGFDRRDTPRDKLRKLADVMAPTDPSGEDVALLAELLSLPTGGLPVLNLSPRRRKEKTFEALNRQLDRLARERPLLVVFEDVHWSDPTTLELLDLTVNRIQSLPVLLVVTFRPDFQVPWGGLARVSLVRLSRLDREDSALLVTQIMGGDVFANALVDRIVAGSDGVPLFIEELTKAVVENPALRNPEEAAALAPLDVPATLQASLMARLDRLPAAKAIAQIAAVIGRDFSYGLLSLVAEMPEPDLLQGLNQLVAAGLVLRRGAGPNAVYAFKHALVQDTAYESLLRTRRSAIHARVVSGLLELDPDFGETQPALLAHHCARAGLIEQAAAYYRRAGERSAERAALTETRGHLERGLMLVRTLPAGLSRRILEVELKLALGRVLLSVKGSADVEAGRIFEEAVELCRGLDRIELLTRALWGYWFNKAHRRELMGAENAVGELLRRGPAGEPQCDPSVARAMLGVTRFWQGILPEAQANLKASLEFAGADSRERLDLAIVSNHLDVHVRMQHALVLTCLGHLDQAAAEARLATQHALELTHLPTRAIVIAGRCRHDYFIRDDNSLRENATYLFALAEEQGFPFYLALARLHLGWLNVREGRVAQGLQLLQTGLDGLQATDAVIWQPIFRGIMAEALSWSGDADRAELLLDEARAQTAQTGGAWFSAELHRCKGEVLLARSTPDFHAAEQSFREAIAVSESQSAKLWQLKAAIGLARLWSRQGKRTEARELLVPIHGWFAGQIETADVTDAAALLSELAD